jgi:hypothetical protein
MVCTVLHFTAMSGGSMTYTGPSCAEWQLRAIEPPLGPFASTPAVAEPTVVVTLCSR